MNIVRTTLAACLILAAAPPAHADPVAKGLAIAEEVDQRDEGFKDTSAVLRMTLINANGDESERELRMKTLEVPGRADGDKTLITFDTPADLKGTALLTFAHITEPDDQWLYLSGIKRVKRISSSNKSGPFLGSEFAYEDFSGQEVDKYTYRHLRDEPCPTDESLTCFVVERVPTYENSGYTKQIGWIDQNEYRYQRTDYFDRKGDLLKTLTLSDYRQYLDKHWRAHELFMKNHLTGKSTRLSWSEFEFKTGLDDDDFNKASLKRAR